jgi:hypothetical protein
MRTAVRRTVSPAIALVAVLLLLTVAVLTGVLSNAGHDAASGVWGKKTHEASGVWGKKGPATDASGVWGKKTDNSGVWG